MTIRKCSTCKHYEPAPIWRKGWCRNPLLYSPQQSHLVGEDDLDCDRGMGNYWEPIDQDANSQSTTGSYGFVAPPARAERGSENDEGLAPMHLRGYSGDAERQEPQGGDVSQYGGPGRPSGSGGFGSGSGDGGGDDDRYTSPFGEPGGQDPHGSERPPFGYQTDDRYWTDYLRIAAPVVGVILMLGLVWFWVANMLSDNDDDDVNNNDEDLSGPVIPADTPTPITIEEDDEPTIVSTPEPDNDPDEDVEEEDAPPTTIGPGATVVVVGTGEEGLNVRSDASTDAEVLESVTDGTTLLITGESTQTDGFTWWPVDTGSVNGFVAEDFVELSQ